MPNLRFSFYLKTLSVVFAMSASSVCCVAQDDTLVQENTPTQEVQVKSSADSTSTKTKGVDSAFLFSGEEPKTIEELRFMEKHFAELAKQVFPATVNIQMGSAQGTGVVVSSDGYILTAAHVIAGGAKKAKITFVNEDGTKKIAVSATPLGNGEKIDSGMLKIDDDEGDDFPYLDVGISSNLKLGQWVMAVGHPGGLDEKRGLVVRLGRIVFKSDRVIKTDCTLVGGDSGGPLIDMNGDVIGIHSRIGATLRDNLHVPADTYSVNWDDMAAGVILDGIASLGFSVVDNTNEISSMTTGGPAEKAGLEEGDIILRMGAIGIVDKKGIGDSVKRLNLRPNKIVSVIVERDGEKETIQLKVGQKRSR